MLLIWEAIKDTDISKDLLVTINNANPVYIVSWSTFERGDQLTEVSHYFLIPLFQQVTVTKNQPVTIINCLVHCWEDDFSFTQGPQKNDIHLNLKYI